MEFTAEQIAEFLNGEVVGNKEAKVWTFAKIEEGTTGALSFLSNMKYAQYLYETKSSVVLVNSDFEPEQPVEATLVKVANAYQAIAQLLQLYESMKPKKSGISPLAYISESATIGNNVYVGPFAYIGDKATIGDNTQIYPHANVGDAVKIGANTILYPNVTIYQGCKIGNRCIIGSSEIKISTYVCEIF